MSSFCVVGFVLVLYVQYVCLWVWILAFVPVFSLCFTLWETPQFLNLLLHYEILWVISPLPLFSLTNIYTCFNRLTPHPVILCLSLSWISSLVLWWFILPGVPVSFTFSSSLFFHPVVPFLGCAVGECCSGRQTDTGRVLWTTFPLTSLSSSPPPPLSALLHCFSSSS